MNMQIYICIIEQGNNKMTQFVLLNNIAKVFNCNAFCLPDEEACEIKSINELMCAWNKRIKKTYSDDCSFETISNWRFVETGLEYYSSNGIFQLRTEKSHVFIFINVPIMSGNIGAYIDYTYDEKNNETVTVLFADHDVLNRNHYVLEILLNPIFQSVINEILANKLRKENKNTYTEILGEHLSRRLEEVANIEYRLKLKMAESMKTE